MSLAKSEKTQLRQLISQPQWAAFDHLIKDMLEKIKDESVIGDTEWDTLKKALSNDGQARGIQRLVQEVYLQIQSEQDDQTGNGFTAN